MQVFSGLRGTERVVHGTVGGCVGRSLLEVTGHFCAIVGLARSVRMGPLLGIDGGSVISCSLVYDLFFDLAFILDYDLDSIWHFIRIYFVEIA